MNGLFDQVKTEVEAAKNILADIRDTLRNDGPDRALEQKRLALDGDHNPILNARTLLEQVAQRFKNQPSKTEMNLIADLLQVLVSCKLELLVGCNADMWMTDTII